MLYKSYVADSLYFVKHDGAFRYRFTEIMRGIEDEEEKDGDEVVQDIIIRAGLRFEDERV